MLKKCIVALSLVACTFSSHATVIEYNGYSRDSASKIVIGGGLEWLMWDVTKGSSINQALVDHGPSGWKLASNTQVKNLFDAFQFGRNDWTANESVMGMAVTPWDPSETGAHEKFVQLFGNTLTPTFAEPSPADDPHMSSQAVYGSDADKDKLYNATLVRPDYVVLPFGARKSAHAYLIDDKFQAYDEFDHIGVALVRDIAATPPSQVSLPGTLSTLALGLVLLGVRRRQASSR